MTASGRAAQWRHREIDIIWPETCKLSFCWPRLASFQMSTTKRDEATQSWPLLNHCTCQSESDAGRTPGGGDSGEMERPTDPCQMETQGGLSRSSNWRHCASRAADYSISHSSSCSFRPEFGRNQSSNNGFRTR